MKAILFTVLLSVLSQQSQAWFVPAGNDQGNGGGVICVAGKCNTLADSGLVMSPEYPDFWIPTDDVLNEINRLVGQYPFPKEIRDSLLQSILWKMTHFKAVEVVDQQKVDQVLNVYKDTIKAVNPNFDFTNFKIVAISSDNTSQEQNTYLLPDFFTLDFRNQAKILIHEGLYRGKPSQMLKYILQLESALKIFDNYNGSASPFRTQAISAQIAAYNLGVLTAPEAFALVVFWTYRNFGDSFDDYTLKSLVYSNVFTIKSESSGKGSLSIDTAEVQKNSGLDPRTAVMLLNFESVELKCRSRSSPGFDDVMYFAKNTGPLFRSYHLECVFADPNSLKLLLPK